MSKATLDKKDKGGGNDGAGSGGGVGCSATRLVPFSWATWFGWVYEQKHLICLNYKTVLFGVKLIICFLREANSEWSTGSIVMWDGNNKY